MLAKTYNQKGEVAGQIELPKDIFEVAINADLVYQVVTTQMGNRRQGTAHSKNRGEVSGGGKKPWKQKGTGRARHASNRSPIWRHGGVVFGPRNDKIYGGKINKKMRRKALAMVLSAKVADNSLIMMDSLELAQAKTREMSQILVNLRKVAENFKSGSILIALPKYEKNTVLAARNLPKVMTMEAAKLNVLDLLNTKYLLMPVGSLEAITKNLTIEDSEPVDGAKTAKDKRDKRTEKTRK